MARAKFCPKCDTQNLYYSDKCSSCGTDIRKENVIDMADMTDADRQAKKLLDKYQLDELGEKDLVILRRIANDLAGNNFFKAGMALSFAKPEEQAKTTYLSALVEQNWMIIRQLGELNKNIEKLLNK